ncbi:putative peptidoglycan binding protein [Rhodobacter viridis]|uniref:Putative peptidoglycan binding protein n=1 Tax=Rhodobacter viridis TaxID=1054202 RepID=A0A318U3S0_9RHOB|nr:peptidoglycan-binding domain-containing protein [Rhodobacter viridis]PYF10209.1 putative peptidoglycan binding protein [Rhodobacter viridis]
MRFSLPRPTLALLALCAALAGCTEADAPATRDKPAADKAEPDPTPIVAPPANSLAGEWLKTRPGPEAKGCFTEERRPAVVETVTEHVLVDPETRDPKTGVVIAPATYRTTTQARIVSGGGRMWFASVCASQMTMARTAVLQRALWVRGLYDGPLDGQMSAATREAIRRYQTQRGLLSAELSLRAAREMGVVSWLETPEGP